MLQEPDTTAAVYWENRWEEKNTGWHRDTVHEKLAKYMKELTGGRSNARVFVPLCGKSIDMLWLAEQGHEVVGVELSKLAIESFFKENNLEFSVETVKLALAVDLIDVYKCVEKKITIFCCDLFAVSEEDFGKRFDAIWDRGSLSAMQPAADGRGKRYTKKMRSLLADDGSYLLESHYYKLDRGNKPPASISVALRNEIYGEDFVLKALEIEKVAKDTHKGKSFDLDLHYHLIKPKLH